MNSLPELATCMQGASQVVPYLRVLTLPMSPLPRISPVLASSWWPSLQAYATAEHGIPAQCAVCNECTTITRSTQQDGHKRNTLGN